MEREGGGQRAKEKDNYIMNKQIHRYLDRYIGTHIDTYINT